MTSERAYRPRTTHAAALDELLRSAGSQFDPNVVAAFLSCSERERLGQVGEAA
jgi:HD-GYP domain-containing protein (c-di-GMP phosphodiesterase class II)